MNVITIYTDLHASGDTKTLKCTLLSVPPSGNPSHPAQSRLLAMSVEWKEGRDPPKKQRIIKEGTEKSVRQSVSHWTLHFYPTDRERKKRD